MPSTRTGAELRAYVDRLKGFATKRLTIGVQGAGAARVHPNGNGQTVGEIATHNHFGDGHIPARPFLRVAMDKHRTRIRDLMARAVASKAPVDRQLAVVGALVVGLVQETISDRVPPKNADSTIARKGSDVPLIDSGLLRQSISYEVQPEPVKGGGA